MSDMNINNMDDKQLRNEVQLLRDELAIMKRKYEDILYNLDTNNFSSRFVKEQGDMKTAIDVTAKGIESKVSNEEFESTKTQLANRITSEVKTLSDADKQLSSKIEQTAEGIRIEIETNEFVNSEVHDNLDASINMTAKKIESVLSKNISAKFISNSDPNTITTSQKQKGMLCEYDETLYYYNDVSGKWKVYPYADGVKSQFLQTADGFNLTNDTRIDGSLIVSGTIDADRISTEIAQVNKSLRIGNLGSPTDSKCIEFNNTANISACDTAKNTTGNSYKDCLKINAQRIFMSSVLDLSGCRVENFDLSNVDVDTTAKFA